jgi:hypothetical protein
MKTSDTPEWERLDLDRIKFCAVWLAIGAVIYQLWEIMGVKQAMVLAHVIEDLHDGTDERGEGQTATQNTREDPAQAGVKLRADNAAGSETGAGSISAALE